MSAPEAKETSARTHELENGRTHEHPRNPRMHRVRVRGEELLGRVRALIHEGNTRRIIVIGDDGTTLLEIPLTAGIVGTVMAPALVAVGAIAALATNYTLLIEARGTRVETADTGKRGTKT